MWGVICDALVVVGVDLFVLISGYFGIRLRWKSFLNLVFICLFFRYLHFILDATLWDTVHSVKDWIIYTAGVIEQAGTYFWFIRVYFYLMIISPCLNLFFERLNDKETLNVFVILSIVNIGLGFFMHSSNGYDLANFIFMYYAGYLIKRYKIEDKYTSCNFLAIYLAACIVTGVSRILTAPYSLKGAFMLYNYNSPLVVLAAISLFCFFLKFNVYNKAVNYIAASAVAVYLFHEQGCFREFLYSKLNFILNTSSIMVFIVDCFVCIVLLFAVAIILDKLRLMLFGGLNQFIIGEVESVSNHVMNRLENIWNKKILNNDEDRSKRT